MTTSVLATHTRGYLSDHDLQVIRDFALEAPWEWRIALEALVEDAAEHLSDLDEHEKLMREYDNLQETVKSSVKELQTRLALFEVELANASRTNGVAWVPGNTTLALLEALKEDVNDTLDTLDASVTVETSPSNAARSDPQSPGKG